MKWIVIGGDSLIGSGLIKLLKSNNQYVLHTTRKTIFDSDRVQLDLAKPFQLKFEADVAFICAGIPNILYCEENPEETFFINVKQTFGLISRLIESGIHVIFLSSSAVFNGKNPFPKETDSKSPTCEYGRQKSIVEDMLLKKFPDHISVIRLTKVLDNNNHLLRKLRGEAQFLGNISIFNDLMFSPISLTYAIRNIFHISSLKIPGVFHLSLDSEISYYEFFLKASSYLDLKSSLIMPSSSTHEDNLIYRPTHTALSMELTTKITRGLVLPEKLCDSIRQLPLTL